MMNGWAILREQLDVVYRHLGRAPELDREVNAETLTRLLAMPAAGLVTAESVIESGRRTGVAVIPLRGVITPRASYFSLMLGGGYGLQGFRSAMRAAIADDEIGAVVIDVDSPGGSCALVTETAQELRSMRGAKPIVAVANTMCASAAYEIAVQADEVVVTPSGLVGSIGVYCVHIDWSAWNERFGIDPTYVYAGRYKVEANEDEPLSDDAHQALQKRVDELYAKFVTDVAKGRGVSPKAVRQGFGEGRVVGADEAVSLGMADRVGTFEETVTRLVGGKRRRALSSIAAATEVIEPSAETDEPEAEEVEGAPGPDVVDSGDQEQLASARQLLESATQSLKGE